MTLRSELAARFRERDIKSGAPFLMLVLMEEIGELAEAIRRGEREEAASELADVAFMTLSIANVLDVDLEGRIRSKFLARSTSDVTKSWTDLPE